MMGAFEEDVSRETLEKLQHFSQLVEKWTAKINLISKPSVPEMWERHILDSLQIYTHAPNAGHWVALMSQQDERATKFTLVESDQRKCAFLRTAIRELELNATVANARIEAIEPLQADVLSARALSDLTALLGFADRHLLPAGTALFPKGENWRAEDAAARETWAYTCDAIQSQTNPAAAILKIKEIKHV